MLVDGSVCYSTQATVGFSKDAAATLMLEMSEIRGENSIH